MTKRPDHERWFAVGQIIGAVAVGYVVAAHPESRGSSRFVAAAVFAASATVGALAWFQLRHSFQVAPSPRANGRLEQSGIYRVLRHPMYFAVQGFSLAAVLWRPSRLAVTIAVLHYAFYWAKARYEEQRLRERYSDYEQYQAQSFGLWP